MNELIRGIAAFFLLALSVITISNTVLTRAFDVSRLISLIDATTDTLIFGVLLATVNVLSGIFFYTFNALVLVDLPYLALIRPLAMVLCMALAFFIVFVLTVKFANYDYLVKAVAALPLASFNCTVIGTLLISLTSQYSLASMIAFGLGSSVGFVLAVLLVTEGQRKLQSRAVPAAFRGLPATLLFLAGLALALYGLTGHSFAF